VFDLIKSQLFIYPKSHFANRTFRGSNCSSMDISKKPTYLASAFQILMTRRVVLSNAIEQLTTEDTYKTGAPEFGRYV